ncbi:TatD family deoxyribonuclease [candidate division WOR-3 bacterium]|uniref:TatD family deoxyribonuclease n=1 Tax=candidate division WOR-3 bacterium TaxID=2052148 RepID=A0A938BTE4_UNCW3|nr:TatD family deoxyribonuclease [candidate division WOR-3 bacterium]
MSRRSKENPEGLKMFDSHCHLTDAQFGADLAMVLKRAHSAGVRYMMTASQSVPDSRQVVALSRHREGVYCAVGVHPHDSDQFRSWDVQALKDMCIESKVKAIGEIGLDFFRGISSRGNQETAFHAQVELARMLAMPMIIHIRDAASRARSIVDEHGYYAGVLHCFSADKKLAEWAAEKGLFVSFSGNITYGEERLEDIVRAIPRDLLMVETDAPFLAPAPSRGQRNEPAMIRLTVEKLAQLVGITPVEAADLTRENALRCFRI